MIRGAAGVLGLDTPLGVPTTESPGVVLPTTQADLPPPNVPVCVDNVARSWVSSLGGSLVAGLGQSHRLNYGTDQLRVAGVAPCAHVNVASALSPGSLLFPFSDSGFSSLSSVSLPSSLSVSVTCSSSFSSLPASSFGLSQPLSSYPSPLPPTPSFPPFLAGVSSVPPGFPPLVSSSTAAPLSSSLPPSPPLPSLSTSSTPGVSSAFPPISSSFSSASSSSSFLDFAAYQAQVLGLSGEYQALARWYSVSGGVLIFFRIFLPFILTFLLMFLVIFLLAPLSFFLLCARLLSLPSVCSSSSFCVPSSGLFGLFFLSSASGSFSSIYLFFSCSSSCFCLFLCFFGVGCIRVASSSGVVFRSPWDPFCSALLFSSSGFVFCSSSAFGSASFRSFFFFCPFGGFFGVSLAAPAVSVAAPAVPDSPPHLFRPFAVSESFVGVGSVPSVPASVSLASASAPVVSAAPLGSASAPGPSSGLPPGFSTPPGAGAPPPSVFAFAPEDPFDPGFQDSAAPVPPLVPESVRAEIRCMYTYLVDLFPQVAGSPTTPPPPRALFEEFFSSASNPRQPVSSRGFRESAQLSLMLTRAWHPCWRALVWSRVFFCLVRFSMRCMANMLWVLRCRSIHL